MNIVFSKSYRKEALPYNKSEILRYIGYGGEDENTDRLIDECLMEAENAFSYKLCYSEFDMSIDKEIINLGFTKVKSEKLSKNLFGCEKIILLAASVGIGIDRLINRYSSLSPSKALVFQAIGAERVESLCDTFFCEIEQEKMKQGYKLHPRFSPGYGDLDLTIQEKIIAVLNCQRKMGITLSDTLLMSPSKSVTAIIGLSR